MVPAQLNSPPEELQKDDDLSLSLAPLYITFDQGYLPHGLFSWFVCRCIQTCPVIGCAQMPRLYRNLARFFVGKRNEFDLILSCGKRYIKVSLKQMDSARYEQEANEAGEKEQHFGECSYI